jgi:hypothetical protein
MNAEPPSSSTPDPQADPQPAPIATPPSEKQPPVLQPGEPEASTKREFRLSRPLTFAAALVLGGGSLLGLLRSEPEPDPNVAAPFAAQTLMPGRARTPGRVAAVPPEEPEEAVGASPQPSAAQSKHKLILFVPDDDGVLQKKTVDPSGTLPSDPRAAKEALASQAVKQLMQSAPETFPRGAALLGGVAIKDNVATLNFNRAFADASFWQGELVTFSALDALAATVQSTKDQVSGSEADGVRILVEGKPLLNLGEADLSQPYTRSAPPVNDPEAAESAP